MTSESQLPISLDVVWSNGRKVLELTRTDLVDPDHQLLCSIDLTHPRKEQDVQRMLVVALSRTDFANKTLDISGVRELISRLVEAFL